MELRLLLELWFHGSLTFLRSLKDLAGGDHVGFGWLEDGVAVAVGLDIPCWAQVTGVVVIGGLTGAGEVVDLGLGLTSGLADTQDLFGNFVTGCFWGKAEGPLAAGFPLSLGERRLLIGCCGRAWFAFGKVGGTVEGLLHPHLASRLGRRHRLVDYSPNGLG
jgi:hypothetical protein